jgi:hypothetical protein
MHVLSVILELIGVVYEPDAVKAARPGSGRGGWNRAVSLILPGKGIFSRRVGTFNGTSLAAHSTVEEVIEYELKTGDDGMEERELRDLETIFAQVEDPCIERTKLHRLRDIIITICGADGWVGIEEFGKAKEAWLTELLKLANGIPSPDTFGRVFALINLKQVFTNGCRGSAPPSKGSSR